MSQFHRFRKQFHIVQTLYYSTEVLLPEIYTMLNYFFIFPTISYFYFTFQNCYLYFPLTLSKYVMTPCGRGSKSANFKTVLLKSPYVAIMYVCFCY